MKLTKEQKERIINQKLVNVEVGKYEQEIALKISEVIGDPENIKNGIKANIAKQIKAIEVLERELKNIKEV